MVPRCNRLTVTPEPCNFSQGGHSSSPGKPPTVTHVPLFQTACKVTSIWCSSAQALSAKNQHTQCVFDVLVFKE